MQSDLRIYLYDDDHNKFFGKGPAMLLKGVEETGSLNKAALSMNMAYTKALAMMKQAETSLGFPLTTTKIGGKGGGGSMLTEQAKEFLKKYEAYERACYQASKQLYFKIFSN